MAEGTPQACVRRAPSRLHLPATAVPRKLVCACLLLCITGVAVAASDEGIRLRLSDQLSDDVRDDAPVSEEPEAEDAGGILPRFSSLKLELTVATVHDDNVLRTASNEESSFVIRTEPTALLEGRVGRHDILLGYKGEYANYLDLSDENYFDHEFIADANIRLSRKLKLALDTGLFFGHDQRGAFTSRLTGSAEPDRWRRHHAGVNATFGRAWASVLRTKAGLGIGFQQSGIRYLNNNQGPRDFEHQSFALKGRYNVSPKLSIVADAGLGLTEYTDPATPLDSREISGLVGIAWDATAKTTGEVKFGVLNKDFDDPSQDDFSGLNYHAKVNWSPRTFSTFTAYASRKTTDSGQAGGSAVLDTAGLRWRHGFSTRLVTEAGVEFQRADFEANREDDLYRFDVAAVYRLNRFVELRSGLEYATRESNDPNAEYDNTTFLIELKVTLDRRPGRGHSGN